MMAAPDAIPAKYGAFRTRPAIDLAQGGAFDPITPEFSKPLLSNTLAPPEEPGSRGGTASSSKEILDTIHSALLWENPQFSGFLCIAGLAVATLGDVLTRSCSVITFISYLMVAELALNFVRSIFSTTWLEEASWSRSYMIKALASSAHACVLQLASLHDAFISAEDPNLTLKVAGLLWACVHVGSLLSTWHFICLAYFAAFGYGALSKYCHASIYGAYSSISTAAKDKWTSLGFGRGALGLMLLAVLVLVAWLADWKDRLLTAFLMAVVVRCNLKRSEVDAFASAANNACGPYLRSAKKQAHRLGRAASEIMMSYSPNRMGHANRKPHPQ